MVHYPLLLLDVLFESVAVAHFLPVEVNEERQIGEWGVLPSEVILPSASLQFQLRPFRSANIAGRSDVLAAFIAFISELSEGVENDAEEDVEEDDDDDDEVGEVEVEASPEIRVVACDWREFVSDSPASLDSLRKGYREAVNQPEAACRAIVLTGRSWPKAPLLNSLHSCH